MNDPMLRVRGVHRSFGTGGARRDVLRGVDLDLARGQSVALIGRSGSGKSTLLHAVAGVERVDSGTIEVAGVEITRLDDGGRTRLRRDRIGLVFQSFHLFPTLTVLENVALPLDLAGCLDAAGRTRALELLERVGLADRARTFPEVLSGGEQQRVAVARAVVHQPALLLADEPTGNLDHEAGDRVLNLLAEVVAEQRGECAMLMVTHSREAASRADRILAMDDGVIVGTDAEAPA